MPKDGGNKCRKSTEPLRDGPAKRKRKPRRSWASIVLEREVLRGELPPDFMPRDARSTRSKRL